MSDVAVHKGSGNVYKDLGFREPEKMQAKAALATRILAIIKQKKWTQEKAAAALNISQPKISLLSTGQFSGFSIERLIGLLNMLNQDVEIVVKNARSSSKNHVGHVKVTYAAELASR